MLDREPTRFKLDCDDDGHWYVVPLDKALEFDTYIGNPDDYDLPEEVHELGCHPCMISFENWRKEYYELSPEQERI
jgi:hypothetical protein